MTTVRHEHLRHFGYCNRGARAFFRLHALDWAAFLREGIDAERLRATNDAQAIALIDHLIASTHGREE